MSEPTQLSNVERIKAGSNLLRGSIAQQLANDADAFDKDTTQVIKHHGFYQQDDRDRRGAKGPDGQRLGKAWMMMVRTKLPGGKLTADQMLAEIELCEKYGGGNLRLTARQGIQIHGVLKSNVKAAIRAINDAQMTTLGACGDVSRNTLCCPAPIRNNPVRDQMQDLADRISQHFLPRTPAYHELWLQDPETGERELVGGGPQGSQIEPLYGPAYLPRKFKVAIALPEDNCVDTYTNDLGLLALVEHDRIVGYHVLVGGGQGVTPSNPNTFPALAVPLAFVLPDDVIPLAEAIICLHRDFSNRGDRKRARMKYLVAEWGLEQFKTKVEQNYGKPLDPPRPIGPLEFDDHMGWHEQGDGRWFYGLNVENGRIADRPGCKLKSAVGQVCRTYHPDLRITAHQSLLFCDIQPDDRAGLEKILRQNGVKLDDEISVARRWSMACVALPTCPLAVTESERIMPELVDQLETELEKLELSGLRFTLRMTGCPNGCARPYNADIGLVGKTKNKYAIYLGGRTVGDRLGFIYQDLVPLDEIVPALTRVFTLFKHSRREGESLGDFCARLGAEELRGEVQASAP